MEQEKIRKYVDNLDVNTQMDLLKKVLNMLINQSDIITAHYTVIGDIDFIQKQIEEFNLQYNLNLNNFKQFDDT